MGTDVQRTMEEEKGRAAKALAGVRRAAAKAVRWRNIVLTMLGDAMEADRRRSGRRWRSEV